jgi:hypothetical protein
MSTEHNSPRDPSLAETKVLPRVEARRISEATICAYAVADAFSKWLAEPDVAPNEELVDALHSLCDSLPGWPDGERAVSL